MTRYYADSEDAFTMRLDLITAPSYIIAETDRWFSVVHEDQQLWMANWLDYTRLDADPGTTAYRGAPASSCPSLSISHPLCRNAHKMNL